MSKDFILPSFEHLKPVYIEQCVRDLKIFSRRFEGNIENKSKERYEISIEKIKNGEPLLKKDFMVLAFCLSRLENEGYLNIFYRLFRKNLNSFAGVSSFVRPFTSYIYNNELNENTRRIYKLFRKIRPKLPNKPRYSIIDELLRKNPDLVNFLMEIKDNIQSKESIVDIEKYCKNIFMKDNDKAYFKYIKDFIIPNHTKQDLWLDFRRLIEIMNIEDKKDVFAGVLRCYKYNPDVKSYPRNWFEFIWQELKDPYDPYNSQWDGMDDVKDVFRMWLAYTKVLDFFINSIEGGDRRRCNFWTQYINCMYRVRHYPEANMALVMEFREHIIVEFAQPNNACYIYSKKFLNLEEIEKSLASSSLSPKEKVDLLKNRSLCEYRLSHREKWEYEFAARLLHLGYNKGRWSHWDSFRR